MKRNWLPYIAIAAALAAGTICTTAFAKGPNKGGFRTSSGGGNSIRSLNTGGQMNSIGRGLSTQRIQNFNGNSFQKFNQGGSNINKQILGGQFNKPLNTQPIGGINKQVLGGKIHNPLNSQPIGGHINKQVLGGQINKQVLGGQINKPVLNKQPIIGINKDVLGGKIDKGPINKPIAGISTKDLGGKLGQKIGGPKIDVHIGQKLGNSIIHCNPVPADKHCEPKCDTGKKHCFPWWCLPNYDPWCKPCYPKVCSQPIVVQVPVAVPVEVPVAVPVDGGDAAPAPAVPAPTEPLMQIPVGSTLTLQAQGLSEAAGQVMLVMDKISLPSQINEWRPDAVTATLPIFGLAAPTPAQLILLSAEGTVISTMNIELTPASPEVAAAAEGNAAELATAALGQ